MSQISRCTVKSSERAISGRGGRLAVVCMRYEGEHDLLMSPRLALPACTAHPQWLLHSPLTENELKPAHFCPPYIKIKQHFLHTRKKLVMVLVLSVCISPGFQPLYADFLVI